MPASSLIRGKGAVKAPIGLVVGIPTETPVPPYWTQYNRAADNFIRGTVSDSVVNTTISTNSPITLYSTTDDLHLGSLARDCEIGHVNACSTSCWNPSIDYNGSGSHGSHSITIHYRPHGVRLKLIQAYSPMSIIYPGIMMFSTKNLPNQTTIPFLDGCGDRLLVSHPVTTGYIDGWISPNAETGGISNYHIHTTAVKRQVYYLKSNSFTTVGGAGDIHAHSIPAPLTWNYKPKYVTLRSYHVSDIYNPRDLIGMWPNTGPIPNGWEIVGEVNDRYIRFDDVYSAGGGNDTIEIGGMTGFNAHQHPYGSSSTKSRAVSPSSHYDSVSHLHYYNHTAYNFWPNTLYLKFIRYIGN